MYVLGDLTDAKDHHPSLLVNQIVQALCGVKEHSGLEQVVIVRGNHDGVDPEWPYFRFLNELPGVIFVHEPGFVGKGVLALPHSRDPEGEWDRYRNKPGAEEILMHATVQGAEAESGHRLDGGLSTRFLRQFKARRIWAGDVHVPQKRGPVEYVGAPYPVRFGDSFAPRVVYLNDRGAPEDLFPPTIRRLMLDVRGPNDLEKVKTKAGDQAKVRVRLERADYGLWHGYKKDVQRWAERRRVELASVELVPSERAQEAAKRNVSAIAAKNPKQLFLQYCDAADVPEELRGTGKEMLE